VATVRLSEGESWLRAAAVGTATLLSGRSLVESGAVESVVGDPRVGRVVAEVSADGRRFALEAHPRLGTDGALVGVEGWCACGRAVPCQHAVAALLTAYRSAGAGPAVAPATAPVSRAPAPWEGALDAVLREPPVRRSRGTHAAPGARRPGAPAAPSLPPVALQFELTDDGRGRVAVRLVGPGLGGRWVRGGAVTWAMLRYGDHYLRQVPPAHTRLLRELMALPSTTPLGHSDRVLFLDTITSRRLWDLLLEAQEAELPLVTSGRLALPVHVHEEPVTAGADVVRDDGQLVVGPLIHLPGRGTVQQSFFVGDPPHGLVWSTDTPGAGLALGRLAAPLSSFFQRLLLSGPVRIPADDEPRFLTEYYPRLAAQIEVTSRDRSVELPASRPPVATLTVTGLGEHRLHLAWSWVYAVGSARRTEPFGLPTGAEAIRSAGRDATAEAAGLDTVAALLAAHPALLEPSPTGPRPVAETHLAGVESAVFMAETLPLLRAQDGVEVTVAHGRPLPQYREVDEVPVVSFEASAPAGEPGTEDWFDLAVTVSVGGLDVPFRELFTALAQEQSRLVLDNGVYFDLDRPQFEQLRRLIVESRELLDAPPGRVRVGRYHAGLWADVEQLGEVRGADAHVEEWRRRVQALVPPDDEHLPACAVPAGLEATLRPYQQAGFAWLATLHALRLGGVLADDMGLGKTLQAIALVLHTREQASTDLPFLVVAPTSVVSNWVAETQRFAPGLKVAAITQTGARRGHDVEVAIAGADLVVTSYTLFRLEFEQYRARRWAGLLLDEAQNVKNHASAGYRCAKDLPAEIKVAITGTPMENNLMELWSLLSITAPGLFARADRFTEYYRHPVERDHDTDRLAQLRRRIRPLMLRRTKDQVARDLPDRQEQVVELELNPRQRTLYSKYLQRERQKVLGLLGDLNRNRFEVFRSLTLLRQAALDISLVDPAQQGVPSTKLDALTEQLDDIVAEGHRVLVFSQFTRFLGLARARLDDAGIEYCYLDGATRNRAQVIARFRNGEAPVFLISLKAGGAGLNLTEADYVILLDPWWNPATEAQAVDRAHRIGQTRKVMVYRLVAQGTIEEKVMALKERKAALTASVLHGDDFSSSALTTDDIRALLT